MARNAHSFTIEDRSGTSDNLDAYVQVLEEIDAPLGVALRPYLASMAAGPTIDTSTIWNALYAATAPTSDNASSNAGGTE
jgi:hypothetical protein